MDAVEHGLHLRAGRAYGREATCGTKIDYKSEESASKAAEKLSVKFDKAMEGYPCIWCTGWHIGRAMTEAERVQFAE